MFLQNFNGRLSVGHKLWPLKDCPARHSNGPTFKPEVWDTACVNFRNFLRFVIRTSRTTFLFAPILDFIKFRFRWFLEALCGNRANFKRDVWDTGWVNLRNFFTFVIRRSRAIYLFAAIFDFVKFHFCQFLEGLYGDRANFKRGVWDTGWVNLQNFFRFVIRR